MADKIRLERDYGAEYEPTDSEDDYSEEEKELLKEVRKGKEDLNRGTKKELMAFVSSSEGEDDDDDDDDDDNNKGSEDDDDDDVKNLMNDSDIEGAGEDDDDDLPDSKDWGSKSRNYYNTDFVDPDYSTYTAEEAEMAKQEEEEARAIQKRLAKQMREEDFFDDTIFKDDKKEIETEKDKTNDTIKLKADFSGLSKREKQQLFQKDSPEFNALVSDFKMLMEEMEKLHAPVLKYVDENKLPMIPALEFTELYRNLALTYCSNIGFYLLLKAKHINVRTHPITKRLAQLKKLLVQLQDKHDNIIKPQLEALLERIVDGDVFEILEMKKPIVTVPKKSKKLSILDKYNENDEETKMEDLDVDEQKAHALLNSSDEEAADEDEGEDEGENDMEMDEDARRGITYEIAKNKGLTPHRKKEARNPRVKHRSKFRKALIRRKGAVRTVRKETKRYGGEISGIKSTVVKSVKFKT